MNLFVEVADSVTHRIKVADDYKIPSLDGCSWFTVSSTDGTSFSAHCGRIARLWTTKDDFFCGQTGCAEQCGRCAYERPS